MEKPPIRHAFDSATQTHYFSIADVVGYVTNTRDARNYWKVLKNRLKKEHPELVTKCNQLKMRARDGKSYLTDVADIETLTELIKLIPKADTSVLEMLETRSEKLEKSPTLTSLPKTLPKETPWGEAELLLDVYESGNYIFIEAFIASVALQDLNIEVSPRKIIIAGKKNPPLPARSAGGLVKEGLRGGNPDYFTRELQWLSFSRVLDLPSPVDPSRTEAHESNGHLTIRLPKI